MKLTTLCYIEREGRYLMLHRTKKKQDINAGKWIGVGGKLEQDESPDDCIIREVWEETGLRLRNLRMRGVITFILPENEISFLYTAEAEGELHRDCSEGELQWMPISDIDQLELWPGDRIFLPLLKSKNAFFSLKLTYENDRLVACALNGDDITNQTLGENA